MKRWFPVVAASLVLFLFSCGPAPTAPAASKLTQRALATSGDLQVELLTEGPLAVGQNRVFYKVTEHGEVAPHAELTQRPVMKMMSMQHACPLVNPDHMANEDGLFEGLLVFTMASTETEPWSLALDVLTSHDAAPVTVDFGTLAVADSAMKKVVTRDGKKIVLTFGLPEGAKVGANPVLVTAHKAADMTMMSYATVDDLTFTLTPEMPSMGHGSNGNVSPTRGDDGLYRGTAVFSMAGDWVVHLGVKAGDTDLGTFDFAFDL